MKRPVFLFSILIILLIILAAVNLTVGSINVSPSDMIDIFSGRSDGTTAKIITGIRLPRIIEAAFLGGALALSGYLLQSFFANPIAGPYVLGISSGAKLTIAVLMVISLQSGFAMRSWMMVGAAFVGSLAATALVLAVSSRVSSISVLVVCGVMLGYICSAATELLVTFADDSNIVNLHNWSLGTFSSASMQDARSYIPIVLFGLAAAFLLSKPTEAYLMGENYARSLGINVKRFRTMLILTSSVLSAVVTAFAGPVSFVGIAVPHVVRQLFKTNKPRIIIPAVFIAGADFCLLSDLLARRLFAPTELSISTITSIFGAPIVISMMLRSRRK